MLNRVVAAAEAESIFRSAGHPAHAGLRGSWTELQTFLALARLRSAARVSELFGISRPTVARHVRRVQDVLKTELIVFTNKGAFLTAAGEDLARILEEVDQQLAGAADLVGSRKHVVRGKVRVSITDGFGSLFLVPALPEFADQYPDVAVNIRRPISYEQLRGLQTDIMVGFNNDTGPDVVSKRLGTVHLHPFASKEYLARKGVPSNDNLEQHDFLQTRRYDGGQIWRPWTEAVERGRVAHGSDTSITYSLMVKAGLGIGLLPTFHLFEPAVEPAWLGFEVPVPFYAVALAERMRTRHVRAVFEMIEGAFANQEWFSDEFTLSFSRNALPAGYPLLLNIFN